MESAICHFLRTKMHTRIQRSNRVLLNSIIPPPPAQTISLIETGIFTHITYTTEAVGDVYEIKCCDVCTHADIF